MLHESAVIGSLLLDPSAIRTVASILDPSHFTARHREAVAAMLRIHERDGAIDTSEVVAEMGGGDPGRTGAWLLEMMGGVASSANLQHHLAQVRECYARERLAVAGKSIVDLSVTAETSADAARLAAEQLESLQRTQRGDPVHVDPILGAVYAEAERRSHSRAEITGIATGLADLDRLTLGLQGTDLVIVGGRPAMGKSALAMGWAMRAAQETSVLVFSLEMGREQLMLRAIASEARFDSMRLRRGDVGRNDWTEISCACSKLSEHRLWIDDTAAISLSEVRAKCRAHQRQHGLGLVVVDYLQLMTASDSARSREQEVGELSRGLKALAKDMNIPVVALSQLNRGLESRPDKRPRLSDLRESGSVEQDADLVLFVYRDEVYIPQSPERGIAELILAKHRSGAIGVIKTRFAAEYTRFDNLETSWSDRG